MSEMVIFNCPAYMGFTRDIPDWLDNTNCGHYAGQVPCQDCTDCIVKQVIEKLKNPNNCKYSGKPLVFTDELLQLFDIEEIK